MQARDRRGVPPRMVRLLVLAAFAALLAAGCGSGGSVGAKGLSQRSQALQSLAAEGALLAQDSVAGKSTDIYRREHSSDLSTAASQEAASLQRAKAEPALEAKLAKLRAIAARVRADLDRLGGASKQEQRALALALEAAAHQSERIGSELG